MNPSSPSRNDGVTIASLDPSRRPSRNDGVTIACELCGRAFVPAGRRRFCSDSCRQAAWRQRHPAPVAPLPSRAPRLATVYQCTTCETRYLGEQWCPDCQRPCRRLGPGGLCPHCDEPVALTDLVPIS
jgi:hypothetical protein